MSGRRVAICALVLVVGVFAVVGVGTTGAESTNNETQTPIITDTGEGREVFVHKNRTTIENVSVKTDGSGARIFISTEILENKSIETATSNVSSYNIIGGRVTRITQFEHKNHTVFEIVANKSSNRDTLKIDYLTISGLDSSKVNSTIDASFKISVSGRNSGVNYSHLLSDQKVRVSESFELVTNSVSVSDQATISTEAFSESPTTSSLTIDKFVSNVNSTIVITQGYDGNELAGFAEQPATPTQGKQNVSIRLTTIGGEKRVHIIPDGEIELDKENPRDTISDSILNSAIATDTAYVYSGIININNQTYNNELRSNLTIGSVDLLDMRGGSTPYVVSVHPITNNHRVAYDTVYGYSGKLVGEGENVSVNLENPNSSSELYTKNKLAAVLQLYNNTATDSVSPKSVVRLPNSDLENGFVGTGISDTATVTPNQEANTNNKQIHVTELDGGDTAKPTIYSGSVIVDNNSDSIESRQLYSVSQSTRVLSSVGYSKNNSGEIKYRTKGLESGEYVLAKNRSSKGHHFGIIGSEEQYVQFDQVESSVTNSSVIGVRIQHHTPESRVSLQKSNDTTATIELATPKRGATTLELNTYLAATESLSESVSVRGSNASITAVSTPGDRETLSAGTYELAVRSTQGLAETSDNATLTLARRSTNRLTAYTGPEAARSKLETAAAVRDAIAEGTLSQTDRIDAADTVVYAVNASGLTGLVDTRNATLETARDLARLDGLEFGVRSVESNGTRSGGDTLGEAPSNATVHVDRTGLYVVTGGDDAFPTDGAPGPGTEFTAAFRVADDHLQTAASDRSNDHRVNETVTFVAAAESAAAGGEPERVAGGGAAGGGGGSGNGGGGGAVSGGAGGSGDGGSAGGAGRAGGAGSAGPTGATQGATPAGSSGRGSADDAGDTSAPDAGESAERNASERAIRFAPFPTAAGWLPFERGSNGLVVSTGAGQGGSPEASAGGASPADSARSTGGNDAVDLGEATAEQGGRSDPEGGASARPTPTYENAPIRATAEDVPGFGPLQSVAALAVTVLTAIRRLRPR